MTAFDPTELRTAVNQVLATATIPDHHGVATIVDQHGAHVALATRVGAGWTLTLDGGYDWSQAAHGFTGQLVLGKHW